MLTLIAFLNIISNRILTVGHEKLGYEVNVPVTSSAHRLRWGIWQTEALVQLWKRKGKPVRPIKSEALQMIKQLANEDSKRVTDGTGSKMRYTEKH